LTTSTRDWRAANARKSEREANSLSLDGHVQRPMWGLDVDDAHWRPDAPDDAGLGWVWVKTTALTQKSILDALKQGYFYASSGPQIYDLQLEGGQVRVRCSPAVSVDFIGSGPRSRRVAAPPGETLTMASYRLDHRQRYVRVACQDSQSRWAWSNPIFLDTRNERES